MNLIRLSGPPELVVSLAEAKAQLRVADDDHDQDAMIVAHVRAAQASIEGASGWLGRGLTTSHWLLYLDSWPFCEVINLPLPPCQSVDGVVYTDPDGNPRTVTDYVVYGLGGNLPARLIHAYGASWPATRRQGNAVEITFTAGYGSFSDVPEDVRAAVLLMAQGLYDGCSHDDDAVNSLLMPHRVW